MAGCKYDFSFQLRPVGAILFLQVTRELYVHLSAIWYFNAIWNGNLSACNHVGSPVMVNGNSFLYLIYLFFTSETFKIVHLLLNYSL